MKIDAFHFKTGGQLNTELFKKVYAVFSVTMAFFTLPSWLSSVAFYPVDQNVIGKSNSYSERDDKMTTTDSNQSHVQDYPANTVRGRICMGLRLDWDKDGTKETSDIYIKVLFV